VKWIATPLAILATLLAPAAAAAHPLGNFTVNRFSAIEASGDRLYVEQVLDLAEIPTFQEGDRVRSPGFARDLAGQLRLTVDGRPVRLRLLDSTTQLRPGAGGLKTVRFEAVYDAGPGGRSVEFRDTSFASRIGWREVVVRAERGAQIESASVPAKSVSDELRAYPQDLLSDPLDVRTATASVQPGSGPGVPPAIGDGHAPTQRSGGFEGLIDHEQLGLGFVLLAIVVAAFWGAAHALTPGHGKAIIAAYLVGSRGTPRHALLLGLIVTVTHTAGVFALGIVTLGLSELFVPEQLYPWLNLVSALLVVAVGVTVLRLRVREWVRPRAHRHHHHHHHGDGHHHHHDHDHVPEPGSGLRGLVAVGVSGGLLPCPTSLVVLLAAISLHRIAFGLLLIVAFSLGLASVISGIGLLAVTAKRVFSRVSFDGPVVRALPAVSALVVLTLGVAMTLRSLPTIN
jgi:ABC-type nickel/cobalt efflux system permease component RcnA